MQKAIYTESVSCYSIQINASTCSYVHISSEKMKEAVAKKVSVLKNLVKSNRPFDIDKKCFSIQMIEKFVKRNIYLDRRLNRNSI